MAHDQEKDARMGQMHDQAMGERRRRPGYAGTRLACEVLDPCTRYEREAGSRTHRRARSGGQAGRQQRYCFVVLVVGTCMYWCTVRGSGSHAVRKNLCVDA